MALGKAPSVLKGCASHARDKIRTSVLRLPDPLSAASMLRRSNSAARPKSPMPRYARPRRLDASACKALSPSSTASARACWPVAMALSWSPVILEDIGHLGQHPSQPDPIVERPGPGLGLAHQGELPPILSQLAQRDSQSEAEFDGQRLGVAVLGQVREGLEGLFEGGRRLAERGVIQALEPACWQ